jgi:mRNA interferase MazF
MFGEIVICQFPFTLGAVSKVRPALVLFDLQQDVLICRVTSAQGRGPLDVALVDWQAAGLLRSSVARLDRLVTAEKSVLIRRLGLRTARDMESVRSVWNRSMSMKRTPNTRSGLLVPYPAAWAMIVVCGGLITYLNIAKTTICTQCGRIIQPVRLVSKAEFCPRCGGKVRVSKLFRA